jgi:hypothetical protein
MVEVYVLLIKNIVADNDELSAFSLKKFLLLAER